MAKRVYDIAALDRYIRTLTEEAVKLRKQFPAARWADAKADQFDKIAGIIRTVRQDQQMQGVQLDGTSGKRLDE